MLSLKANQQNLRERSDDLFATKALRKASTPSAIVLIEISELSLLSLSACHHSAQAWHIVITNTGIKS